MAQGFYNVTTTIESALLEDPFVKTVTYGDIFKIDLTKQTIFPLSHFFVQNAIYDKTWTFTISLLCMDLVDYSKEATTDEFLGNDNEQDVLNTQLAVINKLMERLNRGDLFTDLYQLTGTPTMEPFVDKYDNLLAGWAVTFDVVIPNDIGGCGHTYLRRTFSNSLITFSNNNNA